MLPSLLLSCLILAEVIVLTSDGVNLYLLSVPLLVKPVTFLKLL